MKKYFPLLALIVSSPLSSMMMHKFAGLESAPELVFMARSNIATLQFKNATNMEEKLKAKKALEEVTAEMMHFYDKAAAQPKSKVDKTDTLSAPAKCKEEKKA